MNFFKRAADRIRRKIEKSFLLFLAVVLAGAWAVIAARAVSLWLLLYIGFSAWTAAITTVAVLPVAVILYHALKD